MEMHTLELFRAFLRLQDDERSKGTYVALENVTDTLRAQIKMMDLIAKIGT